MKEATKKKAAHMIKEVVYINSLPLDDMHNFVECSSHNPAESSIDESNNLQDQAEGSHDHNEGSHNQEEGSHDQREDSHNQEEASCDQEQSSHDQEGSLNQGGGSGDQGEESHGQEENQEVTGLQLAWEALELSRVIFSK